MDVHIENNGKNNANRIKKHRELIAAQGIKRVEVKVPEADEDLLRSLAKVLQEGGKKAYKARNTINSIIPHNKQNIVDFFQQSPLAEYGAQLEFTRDKDTGEPLKF